MPHLDDNFIMMAYKTISIKTRGPLPKNEQKNTYEKLSKYFCEHFIKVITNETNINGDDIDKYKYDSRKLSYILQLSSKEMIIGYNNNIKLNFFKYVHQYINQTFWYHLSF